MSESQRDPKLVGHDGVPLKESENPSIPTSAVGHGNPLSSATDAARGSDGHLDGGGDVGSEILSNEVDNSHTSSPALEGDDTHGDTATGSGVSNPPENVANSGTETLGKAAVDASLHAMDAAHQQQPYRAGLNEDVVSAHAVEAVAVPIASQPPRYASEESTTELTEVFTSDPLTAELQSAYSIVFGSQKLLLYPVSLSSRTWLAITSVAKADNNCANVLEQLVKVAEQNQAIVYPLCLSASQFHEVSRWPSWQQPPEGITEPNATVQELTSVSNALKTPGETARMRKWIARSFRAGGLALDTLATARDLPLHLRFNAAADIVGEAIRTIMAAYGRGWMPDAASFSSFRQLMEGAMCPHNPVQTYVELRAIGWMASWYRWSPQAATVSRSCPISPRAETLLAKAAEFLS